MENSIEAFHEHFNIADRDIAEESLLINSDIETLISKTPVAKNRSEFLKAIQPGDMLIVTSNDKRTKDGGVVNQLILLPLNKIIQRSPYNSIKLVLPNNKVIGYAISDTSDKTSFISRTLDGYVKSLQTAMVIRRKGITSDHLKLIVKEAKLREKVDYDTPRALSSIFEHWFKSKTKPEEKQTLFDELKEKITPMICSSIIALIFKIAKLEITTNVSDIRNTWPGDILLSPDVDTIIQLKK